MRPHAALGTDTVRGRDWASNSVGNATAAMANALTVSCLFICCSAPRSGDNTTGVFDGHRDRVASHARHDRLWAKSRCGSLFLTLQFAECVRSVVPAADV